MFNKNNQYRLMDLKSSRSPEFWVTAWHVVSTSICVDGKDMMTMKTLGSLLLIWGMPRNLLKCMNRVCLRLGSQRPGGGVVLGLERYIHIHSAPHHYIHSIASSSTFQNDVILTL
jgi:hypothetical protein